MSGGQAHRVPVVEADAQLPAHLAGLLGALHEPALLARLDRAVLDVNAGLERLIGRPRADLIGRSLRELHVSDASFDAFGARLREGTARGSSFSIEWPLARADGGRFLARVSIAPVLSPEGAPVGYLGTIQDLTQVRATEARARLLGDASALLAQSGLEPESILRGLAQLAVRHLCDYCAVELLTPEGTLRRVEVAHADPARTAGLADYLARYPPDAAYTQMTLAMPRRSHHTVNGLTTEQLREFLRDEEHVRAIVALGLRHALTVPLHGRDGMVGVLAFSRVRDEPFSEHDAALAVELCERAAVAYENAELHRKASEIEAKWRGVVENADAWIYVADREGRVQFINRTRPGVQRSQIVGRSLYEWLDPAQRARVRAVYDAVFERAQGGVVTTTALVAGRAQHFEMRIAPVVREGAVVAAIVTTLDVTERMEQDERLHEREAQLAQAQAIARLGSWSSDVATGVLTWSDENYRIHGVPIGEPVTLERMMGIVHPEDRELVARTSMRVLEEGEGGAEYRLVMPDGSIKHVHGRGRVVRDAQGRPVRGVGTTLDITERKIAEAAIRESEERFRTLVTATTHMVWHTDTHGMIADMPEWRAFTGQTVDEVRGEGWVAAIHPEDQPRVKAAWIAAYRARGLYECEYRVRSAAGEYRWFLARGAPRFDARGELVEYIGTWTDVTRQRQAMQEAETLRAQLAQSEKLGAMGSLVGGVAHEIRTPLTYLANNLHLIDLTVGRALSELPPAKAAELKDRIAERIADAHESVERINRIVEELRRYTRLRTSPQRTSASLATFVADAIELFRATHRGEAIVLDDLRPTRPVLADRVQLQQVLLNLVQNAHEAAPADDRIRVRTYDGADGAVLEVADRGGGIPPDVLARIWDPFFTTKTEGTGLGLAVVRKILDAHQAHVAVESVPGEGTTFRVTFPYA